MTTSKSNQADPVIQVYIGEWTLSALDQGSKAHAIGHKCLIAASSPEEGADLLGISIDHFRNAFEVETDMALVAIATSDAGKFFVHCVSSDMHHDWKDSINWRIVDPAAHPVYVSAHQKKPQNLNPEGLTRTEIFRLQMIGLVVATGIIAAVWYKTGSLLPLLAYIPMGGGFFYMHCSCEQEA